MNLSTSFKSKFPFLQNFPECSNNYLILGHIEIKGKNDMDSSLMYMHTGAATGGLL